MKNKIKESEIIETKTTLETYKAFFCKSRDTKLSKNIEDFEISRHTLLARTNCLPINDVLFACVYDKMVCQLCDSNDIETTNNFMLECPAFKTLRVDFFSLRSPTPYLVMIYSLILLDCRQLIIFNC